MDRCALFVDAGYVLADGAMAVHGTRQRDCVSWDYAGLVRLLTGLSRDRTGLPVLRCYWYEATVEGRRCSEHDALADLPGIKLRLGRMRPGRREGVEAQMHRDLTTLARNHAVSDAVIVSPEEDLTEVVAEVQDFGLRVIVVHIAADASSAACRPLRQECDDIVEISGAHLRPFVDLFAGATPADHDEKSRNGADPARGYRRRGLANGHRAGLGAAAHQSLPGAALPAVFPAPAAEEHQPTAKPGAIAGGAASQPLGSAGAAGAQDPVTVPQPAATSHAAGAAQAAAGPRPATAPPAAGAAQGRPPAGGTRPPDAGEAAGAAEPPAASRAPAATQNPASAPAADSPRRPASHAQPAAQARAAAEAQAPGIQVTSGIEAASGNEAGSAIQAASGIEAALGIGAVAEVLAAEVPAGQQRSPGSQVAPVPGGPSQPGAVAGGASQAAMGSRPPASQPAAAPTFAARPGEDPAAGRHSEGRGSAQYSQAAGLAAPAGGFGAGHAPYPQSGGPAPGQPARSVPDGGSPARQPGHGRNGGPQPAARSSLDQPMSQPVARSLAGAVQSAHAEGFGFGDAVARDAPALWLEAVLARKPRMPSDLEAKLLQGSALPADSLQHDEVKDSLRRGFWDALERPRR